MESPDGRGLSNDGEARTSDCPRIVDGQDHLEDFRRLVQEYLDTEVIGGRGLNVDFQHPDQELADLPGSYARPTGAMLLAYVGDAPAACMGYRRIDETTCELKRLYVRPAYRGRHLASMLFRESCALARRAGYQRAVLDTLDSMTTALALYERFGFTRCGAYYDDPLPGALFFAKYL